MSRTGIDSQLTSSPHLLHSRPTPRRMPQARDAAKRKRSAMEHVDWLGPRCWMRETRGLPAAVKVELCCGAGSLTGFIDHVKSQYLKIAFRCLVFICPRKIHIVDVA